MLDFFRGMCSLVPAAADERRPSAFSGKQDDSGARFVRGGSCRADTAWRRVHAGDRPDECTGKRGFAISSRIVSAG
jgi:hypothetical protein